MSQTADSDVTTRLRDRGYRVTSQRLILHRALRDIGRHATADEVLRVAGERLPNLSLPTVYSTLDLFEDLGLVRRVNAGGGPALYDPRSEDHGHFACRRCGRVIDLDAHVETGPALAAARSAGLVADRAEVVVTGLCDACAGAASA